MGLLLNLHNSRVEPISRMAGRLRAFLDERKFFPSTLTFFVTDRCNLRCQHCFYIHEVENPTPKELSVEEIRKILSGLKRCSHYIITGGEPFLREDILPICEMMQGKEHTLRICTNGLLNDRIQAFAQRIPDLLFKEVRIQISFDGPEMIHDKIRGVGAFRKAKKTLLDILPLLGGRNNFYIQIALTLNKMNLNYLEEFLAEFVYYQLPINFIVMRGSDHGVFHLPPNISRQQFPANKELYLNAEEIESAIEQIKVINDASKYNFFSQENWEVLACSAGILQTGYNLYKCFAGSLDAVMYPQGEVSFCEITKPIGNIRDYGYSFSRLWYSFAAQNLRPSIKQCSCIHGCNLSTGLALKVYR